MQTKTKSEQSKRKSCVTWTVLYFACRWLYWFHLWCVCHLSGIHVVSFHAERRPRSGSFLQRWQKTSRHIQRPLALNEQNVWAGFSEDLRELSRRAASKADAGSPRARSVTAPTLASSRSTKHEVASQQWNHCWWFTRTCNAPISWLFSLLFSKGENHQTVHDMMLSQNFLLRFL